MNFNNKTVWITGASSGIGKELAIQFAQLGARVILSARNVAKLEQLCSELNGSQHQVIPLDLAQPEQVLEYVTQHINDIGKVDILINNGGVSQRSLFLENDFSVYRQLMEVNYFGLVALTKAVLPSMVAQGGGRLYQSAV
ncbi:hypothetical protein KAN5_09970 [Pseudoalteromonas sp. KAN5]|nr:hypothetical protein KAN5_09970 [Pseudoalteromonas sp. KAN5]